MATLSIEDFPDSLYKRLQEQARQKNRSLSQEVTRILGEALGPEKPLSILGLEGLGKELWEGIDAAEYIRGERDSWDDEPGSPVLSPSSRKPDPG
jgi:plasmid stability protein